MDFEFSLFSAPTLWTWRHTLNHDHYQTCITHLHASSIKIQIRHRPFIQRNICTPHLQHSGDTAQELHLVFTLNIRMGKGVLCYCNWLQPADLLRCSDTTISQPGWCTTQKHRMQVETLAWGLSFQAQHHDDHGHHDVLMRHAGSSLYLSLNYPECF